LRLDVTVAASSTDWPTPLSQAFLVWHTDGSFHIAWTWHRPRAQGSSAWVGGVGDNSRCQLLLWSLGRGAWFRWRGLPGGLLAPAIAGSFRGWRWPRREAPRRSPQPGPWPCHHPYTWAGARGQCNGRREGRATRARHPASFASWKPSWWDGVPRASWLAARSGLPHRASSSATSPTLPDRRHTLGAGRTPSRPSPHTGHSRDAEALAHMGHTDSPCTCLFPLTSPHGAHVVNGGGTQPGTPLPGAPIDIPTRGTRRRRE
jgi:hypothetical protein